MAIQIPPLTLDDVIGELSAGITAEQFVDAIKQIARTSINIDEKKIDSKHEGEITLKLKWSKLSKDQLKVTHTLNVKSPTKSGHGHTVTVCDPEETHFYVHPGSGYVSVNPINQDDWVTESDPKIRHLNPR
ncbi:MAG: hypothetical protein Q7U57_09570 [Methylovulum sp.]|nr:hypothetical protein [Methylovulum sp.]